MPIAGLFLLIASATGSGQDIVLTQVVIGADGSVMDARVIRRLHPDLDRAALESLPKWQFEPGRLHGAAVRSLVEIEFTFTLR